MFRAVALLLVFGCVSAEMPTVWLEQPSNDGKIIMGENATEGEFPYMASLRRKSSSGHSCGGSILTSRWVLSAAHCCANFVGNTSLFYIYTGSVFLSKGGSNHSIEKVIMHEKYQPEDKWKNDICLIRVSTPFNFTKNTQQITLAPQDWPVDSGDKVTISGWGLTGPAQQKPPDVLQKGVDFVALTNLECSRKTGLAMFPGYLCAVGRIPGQSTWNGDSGGPLVKQGAQVGLTSFGFRPYAKGNPSVYARVTYYVDWIKQHLGPDASQLKFK